MDSKNKKIIGIIKRRFFLRNFFFYFALMIIPMLLIASVSIYFIRENIYKQIKANTETIFSLSNNVLEELLFESQKISIYINSNSDMLLSLFSLFNEEEHVNYKYLDEYYDYIDEHLTYSPYIHSIIITKEDAAFMVVNSSIYKADNSVAIKKGSSITRNKIKLGAWNAQATDVVTFSIPLKYGIYLLVNVNEQYIKSLLDSATQYSDEMILLLNSEDEVISGNSFYENTVFDFTAINREDYIMQSRDILKEGDSLVAFIPKSEAINIPATIIKITLLLTMSICVIAFIIAWLLSKSLYKKINRILELFEKNDELDAEVLELSKRHFDTYHYILERIASNYVRETNLKSQVVQTKLDLTTSQLTALQYQINPHFIFNTLQSIDLAIKSPDRKRDASFMISNFSGILRYSLQPPTRLTSIKEEIDITRKYIALQEIRFQERVIVLWDYDEEEIEGLGCIRMLFQPLIENVYQHGLKSNGEKTIVEILIALNTDSVYIEVSDNGPGVEKNKLDKLKEDIASPTSPSRHIGFYNVNQRLCITFGARSALNIVSEKGKGFKVSTTIPYCKMKNDTF